MKRLVGAAAALALLAGCGSGQPEYKERWNFTDKRWTDITEDVCKHASDPPDEREERWAVLGELAGIGEFEGRVMGRTVWAEECD